MKIYANVASDRASKGQGGNKEIDIELYAFDREHPIGNVLLEVTTDANERELQYLLTWKDSANGSEAVILKEGHSEEGTIQSLKR